MKQNNNQKWKKIWDNADSHLVENYENIHDIYLPRRQEMLSIFSRYANFIDGCPKTFLDLGGGTGAASFAVLSKFNNAKSIIIDGSRSMLTKAKEIAKEREFNIETIYQDLSSSDWIKESGIQGKFSLIISNIMIHHLTDKEKQRFFKDIYGLLHPSGIFIYGDLIKGETEETESQYFDLRVEEIINNKIISGQRVLSFEKEKEYLTKVELDQNDMPATINYILSCLQNANFKKFALIWFYIKSAVFIAKK